MKYSTIVIGDSLACPRPTEKITLPTTYAYQLQEQLGTDYYVLNWSVRSNSTTQATSPEFLQTYLGAIDAHYAIIQLGIVDCAPRLMSNTEQLIGRVAARIPLFRNLFKVYVNFKSHHRMLLTRLFPMTRTPKNIFREHYKLLISEILKSGHTQKIYLINIASPGMTLLQKSYGVQENITAYNNIIMELHHLFSKETVLIDIYNKTLDNPNWIAISDGHHILKPAHDWLANTIANFILSESSRNANPEDISNDRKIKVDYEPA